MKIILQIFLISLCLGCKKSATPPDPKPDLTHKDMLAKGVNLSNWFNDYSDPAQFANRFSLATLQLIKSSGFTYVRIPVGVTISFDATHPEQLNSSNLPYVDAAVNNCIKAGLGVTINLHPWQNDADN